MIVFLDWVGRAQAVVFLLAILFTVFVFVRGIAAALWRLGNGLARRKIALFAKGNNVSSLKSLLVDSKLIRARNIIEITTAKDIDKAEAASIYLVFWHDWIDDLDAILAKKPDQCALVVYAPYDGEPIPADKMKKLDGKRHTAVTNFRGRLLNDMVTSMITTAYERK
jgi:hypothetical protein